MNSGPLLFLLPIWYMESQWVNIYLCALPILPIVVGTWNGLGNTEELSNSEMSLLYNLFGKSSILIAYIYIDPFVPYFGPRRLKSSGWGCLTGSWLHDLVFELGVSWSLRRNCHPSSTNLSCRGCSWIECRYFRNESIWTQTASGMKPHIFDLI